MTTFFRPSQTAFKNFSIILTALTAALGFFAASYRMYSLGFPLDDAWIHQTYARNLAELGEWSFIPGQRSAGSTSPLWTFVVSLGYLFKSPPILWSNLVGVLCLAGTAILGESIIHRELPISYRIPLFGFFLTLEWHLIWAAVSGMETALYVLIITLFFALLERQTISPFVLGSLIGLTVWIRPDGITLLGPGLLVAAVSSNNLWGKIKRIGGILLGTAFLFLPYLVFNNYMAGSWWPNTFYAKQAEYAVQTQIPFLQRLFSLISLPLIGAGITVFPGFLWQTLKAAKNKNWVLISAFLWWLGYNIVYAIRLPVTYQHGRYLIPSMAIFFIIAASGSNDLLNRLLDWGKTGMLLRKTWFLIIMATTLAFYAVGAHAYAVDVAIIQTEMVETAQWIEKNSPPSAIVAAHDIGALGYFGERKIIDLAGLVSPEVIPFIRDETLLGEYMDKVGAYYLMTFPQWYPQLTAGLPVAYSSNGMFSKSAGGENMKVYSWQVGEVNPK